MKRASVPHKTHQYECYSTLYEEVDALQLTSCLTGLD